MIVIFVQCILYPCDLWQILKIIIIINRLHLISKGKIPTFKADPPIPGKARQASSRKKKLCWFWLLVELHCEGSAPAACSACLIVYLFTVRLDPVISLTSGITWQRTNTWFVREKKGQDYPTPKYLTEPKGVEYLTQLPKVQYLTKPCRSTVSTTAPRSRGPDKAPQEYMNWKSHSPQE